VGGQRHAQRVEHGGHHVHALDEVLRNRAARGVGLGPRVGHDEGHALHGVVEQFLLAQRDVQADRHRGGTHRIRSIRD